MKKKLIVSAVVVLAVGLLAAGAVFAAPPASLPRLFLRLGAPGSAQSTAAVVGNAVGKTEAEVIAERRSGKSMADIAAEAGLDLDKLTNEVVSVRTQQINALVAEGTITQADADALLADIEARIEANLSRTDAGRGYGAGCGMGAGYGRGMGYGRGGGFLGGR
jgi:uncharacterized protein YidB (DUF937 family)